MRRWLYRVAYRRAVDILRRRRLIRWESLHDLLDRDELPEDAISQAFEELFAEHEAMRHALAALNPEDTACLLLMVVRGSPHRKPPRSLALRLERWASASAGQSAVCSLPIWRKTPPQRRDAHEHIQHATSIRPRVRQV